MRLATRLAGIRLARVGGEPVTLGELWLERAVVLAFVRHFG